MATQQEVIKAFMKSLDTSTTYGVTALNNAVKACSSFKDLQSVIDQLISDCTSATSVDSFLKEKCGINLNNKDTGAITGSDAGGSKTKTAESVVPETGTASYPSDTSFTKRGLTVVVPSKSTLTKDQQTVVQGLYSWWIDEALKLIEESYGYKFTDSDATVKRITVNFIDSSSDLVAYVMNNSTSTNGSAFKTTALTLNVNMNHFKNLSASNVNGKSSKISSYLDRILAHELTHAIMSAKIDDAQELPNFIMEGMAELTHGADSRASDIKQLVGNPTQLRNSLNVKNTALSASLTDLDYAAGYIFLRYLAKQGSSSYSTSTEDNETSSGDAYTLSATNSTITKGGTYTIAKNFTGTITINTTAAVTIDGTNTGTLSEVKIVTSSSAANLTIKNLTVTNTADSVITFGNGAGNKLTLAGKNVLKTSDTSAAGVDVGGGLTINGTGSLDVTAGAQGSGIGSKSNGESNANITINGGTITATANSGAGIGSGDKGNMSGTITIGGNATVTATAYYGSGIGAGNEGNMSGTITIGGNAKVTATAYYGSGIGAGDEGNMSGTIKIGGKSYVLVTQMKYQPDFVINGKTYTKPQILFENGIETVLSERIIIDKIVQNGTDKDDHIEQYNNSWYSAATINAKAGNDTIAAGGANFLIYAGDGNDSIESVGMGWSDPVAGYITLDAGAGNDTMYIGSGFEEVSDYYSSINGGAGDDDITVNGNYVTIKGGSGNDNITVNGNYVVVGGGDGEDTIKIGKDNSTVNGGKGDDLIKNQSTTVFDKDDDGNFLSWASNDSVTYQYSAGDGNDTIVGFNAKNIIQISGSTYTTQTSGDDVILKIGNGSILLKDVRGKSLNIQAVNGGSSTSTTSSASTLITVTNSTKSPVTIGSAVETVDASKRTKAVHITGNSSANSIKGGSKNDNLAGGEGNDSLYGNAGNDKIYGQANNDKLYGGDGNDSLYGGIGNDTLSGGKGNDLLKGGDGKDIFIYSAGNDIITDYTAGQDKIRLSNASITSSTVSGDNVVFTLNTGKLTVKNGKDKKITIIDANGKATAKKYSAPKTLTVTKNVTLGSRYQNADGSKFTKAVKIIGNAQNNSIKGGSNNDKLYGMVGDDKLYGQGGNDSLYGGSGNDSLWGGIGNDLLKGGTGNDLLKGGTGNDILWGGLGSDTFIYSSGDGKDTVSGFDSGDLLKITGTFTTSYNRSKKEIYFKVGSTDNAITLTDFGSTTTFHVNNDTYQLSGTKLLKK